MVRKPYPIPNIAGVLQKIVGLELATTLDLNIRYYTQCILIWTHKNVYAILIPWDKYQYLRLPMVVNVLPDIFKEKDLALFGPRILMNILT